jgi:hypothetical protein
MKLTQMKRVSFVLAAMLITTVAQAYNKQDAKYDCINKIIQNGHSQYFSPTDIRIEDRGHRSYKVRGKVVYKIDEITYPFTCKVRHGEVVDWRVTASSKHSDKDAAIAAGAGLLAVVAIAAAANDDKHHNNRHENHATGGSAFDDMRYLKKQCKQNIRRHIAHEDQAVKKIHLDTTHLNRRTLRGEGGVLFKRGGGSDISYECKFDRNGRIYDGHYRFH